MQGVVRTNSALALSEPQSGFKAFRARVMSAMNPRGLLSRVIGAQAAGARDMYTQFGWDTTISSKALWEMYFRGGIAKRIVHAFPDEVWGNPPELKATKGWDAAFEGLQETVNIWTVLNKAEVLANMGLYSVVVVGVKNGGRLEDPIREGESRELLFMQVWSDQCAKITAWGRDPSNERFNLPTEYTIYPGAAGSENREKQVSQSPGSSSLPNNTSYKVHWSRVIHVCQGELESQVFGTPTYWSIWNYLTDLIKVVGSGAESYWQTANRGISANVDKDMDLDEEDAADLSQEIEEYYDGQRRFIRSRGVEVKSLGSDVADPSGPVTPLLTLIAGTVKIPQRILTGSEAAHNASTQDKGNWATNVNQHTALISGPNLLVPAIQTLMRMGVLPKVALKKIKLTWLDAYHLSPLEEAQRGNQRAAAANNLAQAVSKVPNFLDRQEFRKWVGLAKDDKGDKLEIKEPTKPGDGTNPAGDGGIANPGTESGNTATPTSDASGKGDPINPLNTAVEA